MLDAMVSAKKAAAVEYSFGMHREAREGQEGFVLFI